MHDATIRRAARAGALSVLSAVCMLLATGCPAPRSSPPSAQATSPSPSPPAASSPADASPTTPDAPPTTQEAATPSSTEGFRFYAREGGIQRGTKLSFVVTDGTRISDVVAEVLETCDGEVPRTTTIGPNLTWEIVDGSFSGRHKEVLDGVSVYTTLEGRFTSATSIEGIIRQESVVAGSVCDTFKLTFRAEAA